MSEPHIILVDDRGRLFMLDLCPHCGGEGVLYTSRYGGNDPDVWPERRGLRAASG